MASVGTDGDQGSKADVCLYFWGRKPFIQANDPKTQVQSSVCTGSFWAWSSAWSGRSHGAQSLPRLPQHLDWSPRDTLPGRGTSHEGFTSVKGMTVLTLAKTTRKTLFGTTAMEQDYCNRNAERRDSTPNTRTSGDF